MLSKLKFIFKYTNEFRWWYTGGIIFLALTLWISVTIPEYLQKSIDIITEPSSANRGDFYQYIYYILFLAIALIFVRTLSRILFFIPARLIERRIKGRMLKKLTSFGKPYFDKNETGTIISRINNDIHGVRLITGFGLMQTFNVIMALSITPYKMWQLSPELTLYCFIPLIFIFIVVRYGMRIMVKNTQLRMDSLQRLSARTISFLSGVSIIKSYNMYLWSESKIEEENVNILNFTLKIAWIRSFVMPLLGSLEQILKVLILFIGGMFVINGSFTIGELTAFIAYAGLLAMPIMGLGWILTVFQQGFVGIGSIQTILNREGIDDEKEALSNSKKNSLFSEGIEVNNLTFTYHDDDKPALENISFSIKPGEIVGVTGSVGSGKTTLVNCINRYLDVEEGMIFIDGLDAAKIKGKDIRYAVKTVTQDVFLFSDSIKSNIKFGADEETRAKAIDKVIYQSSLSEEIERFADQEDTLVGERGIMLSGGQKQRISLARALYTPSKLLILDDVFSAVDNKTERFLIKQIFDTNHADSLFIVSNRISVLERTDKILVLDEGKLVNKGTHEELLKTSEFYRKTSQLQQEKSLEDN